MTPDQTREIAVKAAQDLAQFEKNNGHTEPRTNWASADGTYLAATWSHIAAAGIQSRYGVRSNALAFRDAYLAAWSHPTTTTD